MVTFEQALQIISNSQGVSKNSLKKGLETVAPEDLGLLIEFLRKRVPVGFYARLQKRLTNELVKGNLFLSQHTRTTMKEFLNV
jgi:hypothetical protein